MVASMGTSMTQAASQGLDAFIAGAPPIPGAVPGAPAPGVPTIAQLMPANLQQALGQVENLLIPPGLPRPSQALKVVPTPPPTPAAPAPGAPAAEAVPPAMAQRRRVAERRGL